MSGSAGSSTATPASRPRNCGHWSLADARVNAVATVSPRRTSRTRIMVLPAAEPHPMRPGHRRVAWSLADALPCERSDPLVVRSCVDPPITLLIDTGSPRPAEASEVDLGPEFRQTTDERPGRVLPERP